MSRASAKAVGVIARWAICSEQGHGCVIGLVAIVLHTMGGGMGGPGRPLHCRSTVVSNEVVAAIGWGSRRLKGGQGWRAQKRPS